MHIKVIALDLEATLIDNAMSGRPRNGLYEFLAFCDSHFSRVAIYTTVQEDDAREVVEELVNTGHWPRQLSDRLEFIDWSGEHKDLRFIPNAHPEEILLIDDDAAWVSADQKCQFIPIAPWDGYPDSELTRVQKHLTNVIKGA